MVDNLGALFPRKKNIVKIKVIMCVIYSVQTQSRVPSIHTHSVP